MDRIVIMGAMEDVELNVLKEKMQITNVIQEKQYTFYEGIIDSKEVVLVNTRIGFINASVATTLAIQKYRPQAIISQGIAGAYGNQIHQNDIVIATEVLNINSCDTPYLKRGQGITFKNYQLVDFDASQTEKFPIIKTDESSIKACEKIDYVGGKVYFGRIGSGDIWNKEIDKIEFLSNQFDILCEEMEGFAIGKVASIYSIPFIAIRTISNNEMNGEKYDRTCGKNAQEFVLQLIKKITIEDKKA